MQLHDWKIQCEGYFTSPGFVGAIKDHLAAIRAAPTAPDRARHAGKLGGFLRSTRSAARLELAKALLRELSVEPTQHVARMLMLRAFEEAAETATLNYFAKPGRNAGKKHMDAARIAAASQPGVIARYGHMYDWYLERLDLAVATVKRNSPNATLHRIPQPAAPPPVRPGARPIIWRVK